MAATIQEHVVQAFEIVKEEEIAAPVDIVFETILEQMGPLNSTPEKPMPMKLEAWPGGRWFRDLGNNTGTSGASCRPSNRRRCWRSPVRFLCRLRPSRISSTGSREENGVTRLRFVHRAMGWVGEADRGVDVGWTDLIKRIRSAAANKAIGS